MSQEQRDTPTVHSHSQYQDNSEQTTKKKFIKKDKQNKTQTSAKLTKEERMKIQKQKNREAAQRSRDQHKQYVNNLENQVRQLKLQIEDNKKYCYKCKRQLQQHSRFYDEELEQDIGFNPHNLFEKEEQENHDLAQQKSVMINVPNDQDYFLREHKDEEDYSYLKMMLFIVVIVVGAFIYPSAAPSDTSRNLLQVYQSPISAPIPMEEYPSDRIASADTSPFSPELLVDFNRGLVVRNSVINQQCLDSLIQDKSFSLTNLRTSHPSLTGQMDEGILLCSFQHAKASSGILNGQKSAFLRLFLMGSQIKQMVTANSPIKKYIESNLQLNGIYRVAAEIKQVELISHHNCLL